MNSFRSKVRGAAAHFVLSVRQFGVLKALNDAALRAANHVVFLRVLEGLEIETPDPRALERSSEFTYGFLGRTVLLSYALDPEYELDERFIDEALAKKDRCYGILHGATLASYGWYSTAPTTALTEDLELRFDPSRVYMYKGFTHERYRGRRLHAAGMALALEAYRAEGLRGIVSYVESNNFGSLKSCYRMGYAAFGHTVVLKLMGRYRIWSSPGCRSRGFLLAPRVRFT